MLKRSYRFTVYEIVFMVHRMILLFLIFSGYLASQNILIYPELATIQTLDPITCTQNSEKRIIELLYDSLVRQNSEGEFELSLARDLDISADGLCYTFILKDNVMWNDGTQLTSWDIAFTLSLLTHKETMNRQYILQKRYVQDVDCISPQRISIYLAQPFFSPLSLFTFKILPKHKFTKDFIQAGNDFGKAPVSCGPFQYSSWTNRQIILERNTKYHRRYANLDKIIIQLYDNRSQILEDAKLGKIELLPDIHISEITTFATIPNWNLTTHENPTIHCLVCNYRMENPNYFFLKDPKFRRALLQSLDRTKILADVYPTAKNIATPRVLMGAFPIGSWANDSNAEIVKYDEGYAKQLLREFATAHGILETKTPQGEYPIWLQTNQSPISISIKYIPEHDEIVRKIAKYWEKIGIQVKLDARGYMEWEDEVRQKGQFDFAYTTYIHRPFYDIFPMFDPNAIKPGQSNFASYSDPKLIEIFYELQESVNPKIVREMTYKIDRYLQNNTVHIFLWQIPAYMGYHKNVLHFQTHPYTFFTETHRWKLLR